MCVYVYVCVRVWSVGVGGLLHPLGVQNHQTQRTLKVSHMSLVDYISHQRENAHVVVVVCFKGTKTQPAGICYWACVCSITVIECCVCAIYGADVVCRFFSLKTNTSMA